MTSPSANGAAPGAVAAGYHELFERSEQIAELRELFLGVNAGAGGRLVFVSGDAGIGKSALVRRFCAEHADSARVVWGCCDALRPARPLGPLADIAESTDGELATVVARTGRPHEVVSAWLGELRGRRPTVAVLEDVHWADEATLDLLGVLGRRIERVPALVVATFRDSELDRGHPLRVVLGGLATSPAVRRLQIPPLSIDTTRALATRHGVDGDDLHRKTGGNPFFVTEVLAADGSGVPRTVRDAVLARAAALSPAAQNTLEAVAVAPPRAELWLLEALDSKGVASLDECLASGILHDDGHGVRFRHELARLAFEESIAPDRRVTLHRRTVEALDTPHAVQPDLARLAYHAERAGQPELVLRFAPEAGERASRLGAHREAAAQYERALAHGDGRNHGLPLERRADLHERWAYECYVTDNLGDAVNGRRQALGCYRNLRDVRKQGDQLRWLSRLSWLLGKHEDADREARAAVDMLEGKRPGVELAMAYSNLSQLRMLAWDAGGSLTWGLRAIRLAKAIDDTPTVVHALTNVGAAELLSGAERGRERLARALETALEHGLEDHAARAFFNLGIVGVQRRAYDLVDHYLNAGSAYADAHGLIAPGYHMLAWRTRAELDRGRWAEAAELAGRVLGESGGVPPVRIPALIVLQLVRARRGEPGAGKLLAEARALTGGKGAPQDRVPLVAAVAEAAWLRGDPGAAVAETEQAYESVLPLGNTWATGELATWLNRLGAPVDPPPAAAEPYALELSGQWRRAAERWDALGCPYESALALAGGDEAALRESLCRLQELGAAPAAKLVARRLREHGARGLPRGHQRTARHNAARLTYRELEVLTLMAQGRRNAEIAGRLFVSAKTVDHHVSAVLRKLGAQSRGEASAKARNLGLLETDR